MKIGEKERARVLEELFSRNFSALCFFAYSFVKDEQVAEDIAQDAFESLWSNFEQVAANSQAQLSYLYSTTRNKCLNTIRHDKVRNLAPETDLQNDVASWEDGHLDTLIKSEVYKEVLEAIEKLPAQCRKIYEMTYFLKLSEQEIADKLSISIHSVKSQKQRGKKLLKDYLKDLFSILIAF